MFKILFDRQLLMRVLIKEQFHTNAVQTAAAVRLEPFKKLLDILGNTLIHFVVES